jgi:lipopolysaccharide/colanic/teichoic acid biosynthesis glycosyltransferase
MALVGPRPEDLSIVRDHYEAWMMESLMVRPGLTSPGTLLAMHLGDKIISDTSPEQDYLEQLLPVKVALDILYVRSKCLKGDVSICLDTASAIFRSIRRKPIPLPGRYEEAKEFMLAQRRPR